VIKLLIADDSPLMRRLLGDIFKAQGDFELEFARDGREALAAVHAFRPDVVTLDVNMPLLDGISCLDRIMVECPCPVVMFSSLTTANAEVTLAAMDLGAVDFIAKPAGAISLVIDKLAPILLDKVRGAAKARIRRSLRLADRVRLQANLGPRPPRRPARAAVVGPPAPLVAPVDGVVLIGASTGGPPALDVLLSALPVEFPWPILIAQHMPSAFTGPFARRLDRLCAVTVIEVTRPEALVPGTVYIGKGDADIIVTTRPGGPVVMAAPPLAEHRWHPSVDRLVTTAIEHLGAARLIGVLMTGMGNDGAASMTRLRESGGRTVAESEDSAVVWGMPGELVRAGGADFVVRLEEIAPLLTGWAS
jgi:two-component system chemotaxis response regulator CheB